MGERIDRGSFLRRLFLIDGGVEAARTLKGGFSRRESPAGLIPFTFLRPPGAPMEPTFLARCTRCDLCLEACPERIIIKATEPLMGLGTPVVDPAIRPCTECAKCIAACPEGALLADEDRRMGRAVWHSETCLSSADITCTECVEACPVGPAAIQAIVGRGIIVFMEGCTACGFCCRACPTDPKSLHLEGRPPVPLKGHPAVPKPKLTG